MRISWFASVVGAVHRGYGRFTLATISNTYLSTVDSRPNHIRRGRAPGPDGNDTRTNIICKRFHQFSENLINRLLFSFDFRKEPEVLQSTRLDLSSQNHPSTSGSENWFCKVTRRKNNEGRDVFVCRNEKFAYWLEVFRCVKWHLPFQFSFCLVKHIRETGACCWLQGVSLELVESGYLVYPFWAC